MAKKKVKSVYTKQRNRINRYIRNQAKKGYYIDLYIPTLNELRKAGLKGSEITKRTNILKKLKPKELKEQAKQINIETGELLQQELDSSQYTNNDITFQFENRYENDETWIDNITISSWFGTLDSFIGGQMYAFLKAWANTIINENGRSAFAETLREGSSRGLILTYRTVYDESEAYEYISGMTELIPDQGILYQEEIMNRYDALLHMSDILEQDENWELPT